MSNLQIVPACRKVEAQYVEMKVPLYSHGCERKIKKALAHLKGIYSVNVDYKLQKVTVWGICNKYHVLATVRSKRKESSFWDGEEVIETEPPPCLSNCADDSSDEAVTPTKSKVQSPMSWKKALKMVLMIRSNNRSISFRLH